MTLQKQVGFWVGALAVVILLLWLLQSILLPFIAGFVLAYFLDPIADRLESIGLPRLVATAIILLSAILALAFVGLMIVPVFADQSVKLAGELPALTKLPRSGSKTCSPIPEPTSRDHWEHWQAKPQVGLPHS
jgi:predicted PurR-regulated permease PerM